MKKVNPKPGNTVNEDKWKNVVREVIVDSYQKSSIHHFKYLSSRKRAAKIIWLFMIVCSIATCTYQIYHIFIKWQTNPVIMTFDTQSTPIWKIPFPAVTICPQSKSNHSIFKLTNFFMKKKFKKSERKSLYALAHVCDYDDMLLHDLEYPVTKSSVLNDLKKISLNLEEVIYRTKFTGLWKSDDSEFYEMFTNEGICYSFNLLDYKYLFNSNIDTTQKMPKHNGRYENATKWCLQDGYEDYNVDSYPYRAMLSGVDAGLSLELKSLADDIDTICGNTVDGFKIALHTPGEFPRFEKHFFQIPFGQNLMLSVKPQVITTSENLNLYSPQKRQCYFDGEKRLKYFKMYSQSNCEFECLTEYTKAICGCVKFSMPHSKDTRVCNTATDIDCYRLTNSYFYIQHINDVLKDTEQEDKNKKQIPNHFDEYYIGELELENVNETYIKLKSYSSENRCNCLPACTSLQYDAEISQNLLNVDIVMMNGFENNSFMSNLNIFFKEDHFIAMQRSELYGWVDFIANCGGLVGLFMGFSLLSIIESVYSILLFKSNKNELTTDLDNKPDKINNNTNLRIISVSSIPEEFKKISKNEYLP